MKLYIYDHCPYCNRVRIFAGLKNIELETMVLLNDDVRTPSDLVGKKMVPILVKDDDTAMAESLDIVKYLDDTYNDGNLNQDVRGPVKEWLERNKDLGYYLMMPRCIKLNLKEFDTPSAIEYFVDKKEKQIGSFREHIKKTDEHVKAYNEQLKELVDLRKGETFFNEDLTQEDILLFAVLRNLTMVRDLTWPPEIKQYLQFMSDQSELDLFFDRAI